MTILEKCFVKLPFFGLMCIGLVGMLHTMGLIEGSQYMMPITSAFITAICIIVIAMRFASPKMLFFGAAYIVMGFSFEPIANMAIEAGDLGSLVEALKWGVIISCSATLLLGGAALQSGGSNRSGELDASS